MPDAPKPPPPEQSDKPLENDPYLWYGCVVLIFFVFGLAMRWDKTMMSAFGPDTNDIRSNPGSSRTSFWGSFWSDMGGGGGGGGFGGK